MRIERLTAHAFGPLRGESLELAPGLTVVSGPNESGKSSWHAATRAAVCGVRRGRGAATKVDAEFASRHRPWDDPERWAVEARVALDDGRTIDISQDLAGKVACRAVEVGFGRDVSHEILDGTPDASRWLGLDRDAFAATVCVNQAQILSVADSAASLQDHIQRAATTRGTDATAAEAIERLVAFRRDRVGADRENARGPLRLARNRLAMAREELADARRQHAEYVDLVARVELAEHAAADALNRLRAAEAAFAAREAEAIGRRATRARALTEKYPTPPASGAARDVVSDAVAAALDGWRQRPSAMALRGPTAAELEREIASLPEPPQGDLEPDPAVVAALHDLQRAADAAQLMADAEVERPDPAGTPRRARTGMGVLIAAIGALTSVALLAAGSVAAAVAAIGVALAAAAWTVFGPAEGSARAERSAAEAVAVRRQHAATRVADATTSLVDALRSRGVEVAGDPGEAAARYLAACRARSEQLSAASRREPLTRAAEARRAAEHAAAEVERRVHAARQALFDAASAAGVAADAAPEAVVAALVEWQRRRTEASRRAEEARAEWHELQALLGGATLDALEAEAVESCARADRAARQLGENAPVLPPGDLARVRDELRERHAAARSDADELAGALELLTRQVPDVAEAEEAVAAAEAEWERVQALAATLDDALELLREAQDRVHRDLAPVLKDAIIRWLPAVCAGRWTDVAVDPATLAISVKEADTGRWREARLLSEGTREQIYLLLRVAMAQHLVTTGETAPLILDEVTAQCDSDRKRQLLGVLHAVSAERQVVMFTHDAEVTAWAERELAGPRDRLVRLRAPALERVLV
jgi:DNA repair protein SbcC/Rad50